MYRALLIGCGNIGALYDLYNEQVLTHAKAYAINPAFELTVFDTDKSLEALIANTYQTATIAHPQEENLNQFDCVSICSPTGTHALWLTMAMKANVKVIICEKPVSNTIDELTELASFYHNHKSLILVNYFRRFQPAFIQLKDKVNELIQKEPITNIAIRYQRGFINNASHAFDLLQFLFNQPLEMKQVKVNNSFNDHFPNDPTITLTALWNNACVVAQGLANVQFSHFEIDLYFSQHKIMITDSGKTIITLHAQKKGNTLQPLTYQNIQHECIDDYMKPVIHHAVGLLQGNILYDNFIESVNLNQHLLKYIQN